MTVPSPGAAGRIFISYRRDETAYPAGWLFDRLVEHFGQGQVFKDVDSIQLGDDFVDVISAAVASCDVLLALIGDEWLTITGEDGRRRLDDPDDFVRLEIESALTRNVRVIPVLIDGARMPRVAELPPSLAALVRRQALELSPSRFDFDTGRLLRVLSGSLAEVRAEQAGSARPPGGPAASVPPGSGTSAVPPGSGTSAVPPGSGTSAVPPGSGTSAAQGRSAGKQRRRVLTRVAAAGGVVVVAVVVLVAVVLGGQRTPSPPAGAASPASSPGPASPPSSAPPGKVILTDDFSTTANGWADGFHPADGSYTGNGKFRLMVTGANGQSEFAGPTNAAGGLGGQTSLNLSISVDARMIAGAAHGYGYGIACRADGNGNYYAFVIQDHAAAIEKWVDNGARIQGSPASVATTAVHADTANRLQALCMTTDGGRAVHLAFWVNGEKVVDFIDRNHPYTNGYLGLYVEATADTTTTTEAEFDNFTVAQP